METRKPKFFYGWIIVIAAGCVILTMYGTLFTFGVFFKPVLTEFGWTRAMTSGAFSLCILTHGVLSIVIGRLTDKYGPRIVVTACGLSLGIGYLLMSQISSTWELYLFYGILIGMGMGGAWIPQMSTVARWFEKRRGLATGIAASGEGVGILILAPMARWLIFAYGWRTSYIVVGVIALALIISAAQFLKRHPEKIGLLPYGREANATAIDPAKYHKSSAAQDFSLSEAVKGRQFWMILALFFFFEFSILSIMNHIDIHATDIGISETTAANILATIGGVSILGRITLGVLADRAGSKRAIITGLAILAMALLWLQLATAEWMLYLFAAIFGFAFGGLLVQISLIIAESFGLTSHGAIMGVISFGLITGGTLGPVVVGHIFDITYSYQLGFLICAAASIISLVLALLLRPTLKKRST